MTEFDSQEFAAAERTKWNEASAGWRKWWHTFEGDSQHLNERLVAMAGVAPGHRVLDVATGLGEPALTAARVAGSSGHITGCDLSGGMLAFAAERAAELGVTEISFLEQNVERLNVSKASFDAAVCRWGLMLMGDPQAAACAVHEALRPGARFAAAVWCGPEEVPFMSVPGRVVGQELGLEPPDPDAPGPFRLQKPDALPGLLRAAGFDEVASEKREVVMRFDTAEMFATFISEMSSSIGRVLREVEDGTRRRLMAAIADAVQGFADAEGHLRFENQTICAVGRKTLS